MATALTLFTDPLRYASNTWSTDEAEIDRWTNEGGALRARQPLELYHPSARLAYPTPRHGRCNLGPDAIDNHCECIGPQPLGRRGVGIEQDYRSLTQD
jgi:hypothetical protein